MDQVPILLAGKSRGKGSGKGKGRIRLAVLTEEQKNKRKNDARQQSTNKQYESTLKRFWLPFLRLKFIEMGKVSPDLPPEDCDAVIKGFSPESYLSITIV